MCRYELSHDGYYMAAHSLFIFYNLYTQLWKNTFNSDSKYNTYKDTTADRRLQALRFTEQDSISRLLKGNRTKKKNRSRAAVSPSNSSDIVESKPMLAKIGAAFDEFRTHTVNDYNDYVRQFWTQYS